MTSSTAPPAALAPWRPFVAVVCYTLRSTMPGRRWIGVLVPCAAAVLFGLLARSLGGSIERDFAQTAGEALFGLVMPVTCLVVGDAVLGAEVRAGTFSFTWLSPVPTWQIAVGRWLGGSVIAAGCLAVAFAAAAMVAGASDQVPALVVAAATGAAAYVAVFLLIGCVARRAAVWSLAYVFLVERLLGEALDGVAQLSPSWLARQVHLDLAALPGDLLREGVPQGTAAVVRLALVTAVLLVLASRRLRHLRLSGSAD